MTLPEEFGLEPTEEHNIFHDPLTGGYLVLYNDQQDFTEILGSDPWGTAKAVAKALREFM